MPHFSLLTASLAVKTFLCDCTGDVLMSVTQCMSPVQAHSNVIDFCQTLRCEVKTKALETALKQTM